MNNLAICNGENYTVMANDIIKGRQESSLQQARFIRLMVTQIARQDKDLKTFTCRIQDFAEFFGIDKSNIYRETDRLCTDLLRCQVHIGTGNSKSPWEKINWFGYARYDGEGGLTLCLSEQIRPYVLELSEWFTRYQLQNIAGIKSVYGIRLYEILKCDDNKSRETTNTFTYEISKLREMLSCEKKYRQIKEFKEYVINRGMDEINKNTDLEVSAEYIKTGRKITSVQFTLYYNRQFTDNSII